MRQNLKYMLQNEKTGYNIDRMEGKRYVMSVYCEELQEYKR